VSVLTPERMEGLGATAAPKLARMRDSLAGLGSALVAFSGGVDSTFVLKVAVEVLGEGAVALTAISASVAPEERLEAVRLAKLLGARHVVVDSAELDNPAYRRNPTDRCYFCKSELYALCERSRSELGLAAVVDGFNADDRGDHRPGHRAAEEARVHSPLAEVGLTKDEIRALSHLAGLPTWDKPAMPCLASRIPYGTAVTEERLFQVGAAESELRALGLRTFRVRYHGDIARLEVSAEELPRFSDSGFRERVNRALRAHGFSYVALDLEPFRSGRLNEAEGLGRGAS
jgi:pyridinium-3,5-biscarboxylic acid mononucleotide sulfurtransferase